MDVEGEEQPWLATGGGDNGKGVGNRERAERTSTYVIRFAPLRRNCLNSPVGLSASYTLAHVP